jgi:hypothetical protein
MDELAESLATYAAALERLMAYAADKAQRARPAPCQPVQLAWCCTGSASRAGYCPRSSAR